MPINSGKVKQVKAKQVKAKRAPLVKGTPEAYEATKKARAKNEALLGGIKHADGSETYKLGHKWNGKEGKLKSGSKTAAYHNVHEMKVASGARNSSGGTKGAVSGSVYTFHTVKTVHAIPKTKAQIAAGENAARHMNSVWDDAYSAGLTGRAARDYVRKGL